MRQAASVRVRVTVADLLSLATRDVTVSTDNAYVNWAPFEALVPVAQLRIVVTTSWAVADMVICPVLVPWLVPPEGVAVSFSEQPAGAASEPPHAAVIFRVWLAPTVEVYWAYVVLDEGLDGVWPPVAGAEMVRVDGLPVTARTQIALTCIVTVWVAVETPNTNPAIPSALTTPTVSALSVFMINLHHAIQRFSLNAT
jgi:hypothetical protein